MKMCRLMRGCSLVLVTAMLLQLMSCGYILYPERRGQPKGNLDVGVVLLDGVGLLFFLIPGIVAYAVDFSSNAIYVPPGQAKAVPPMLDLDEMTVVRMDPDRMDRETIERVIEEQVGRDIDLASSDLRVYEIDENGNFVPRDQSKPIPYVAQSKS
jgi:hypothetical protein